MMRIKFFPTIFYAFIFVLSSHNLSHAQEISLKEEDFFQLSLASDKQYYILGEAIEFVLTFTNKTPEDRYIYPHVFYTAGLFSLTDEKGLEQMWEFTAIYDILGTRESFQLVPGGGEYKQYVKAKILNDPHYGLILDFHDSIIKLNQLGAFSVTANYEGWDNERYQLPEVFTGKIRSNTIGLFIKEGDLGEK